MEVMVAKQFDLLKMPTAPWQRNTGPAPGGRLSCTIKDTLRPQLHLLLRLTFSPWFCEWKLQSTPSLQEASTFLRPGL